jgi:hypothetical protein
MVLNIAFRPLNGLFLEQGIRESDACGTTLIYKFPEFCVHAPVNDPLTEHFRTPIRTDPLRDGATRPKARRALHGPAPR